MTQEWFFDDQSTQFGPFSLLEMKGLIHIGRITRETRVQNGSTGEWHTAGSLDVLFDQVATDEKGPAQGIPQRSVDAGKSKPKPSSQSLLHKKLPEVEPNDSALNQTHWIVALAYSFMVHLLILLVMALFILSSIDESELKISSEFVDHEENQLLDSKIELEELGVEISQVNILDLNVVPKPNTVHLENQMKRSVDQISTGIENTVEGDLEQGTGFGFSKFKSRLKRENAQTGDVQVSLIWGDINDIDLHVVPPSKERIWYSHQRSRCRGFLDVDMNVSPPYSKEPVENIFWPKRKAPEGAYQIYVHYFAHNGGPILTPIEVMLTIDGEAFILKNEVEKGSTPKLIFSFDYPLSAKSKLTLSVDKKRREKKEKVALAELKKLEEFLKDKPQVAQQRYRKFAERFSGTFAAEKAIELAEGGTLDSQ